MGQIIKNYVDPFVYASCDAVCGSIEEVARELTTILDVRPKTIAIIDDGIAAGNRVYGDD